MCSYEKGGPVTEISATGLKIPQPGLYRDENTSARFVPGWKYLSPFIPVYTGLYRDEIFLNNAHELPLKKDKD